LKNNVWKLKADLGGVMWMRISKKTDMAVFLICIHNTTMRKLCQVKEK